MDNDPESKTVVSSMDPPNVPLGRGRNPNWFKYLFSLLPVLIVVVGIMAATKLTSQRQIVSSKAAGILSAGITLSSWTDLVQGWPVNSPDDISFFLQPNGDIAQILIKGSLYYYRSSPQGTWASGEILTEANQTTNPFPSPKSLDSFTTFYGADASTLYQTVTKGSIWWSHIAGQPWRWTGTLFAGETVSGGCAIPLPSPAQADSLTTFPWNGSVGVTITRNAYFWTKTNSSASTYTICGTPIAGYTGSFTGHTAFKLSVSSPLSELFTNGSTYWFYPNVSDRQTFFTGTTNSPYPVSESAGVTVNSNSVISQVSPNIFGANLIWHPPHAPDVTKISNSINSLGVKLLRFPGGCGGDSFTGLSATTSAGLKINDFVSILANTNTKPLYTFNLEGTDSHANLNCHNRGDYRGNVTDVQAIVNYFNTSGHPLTAAETGNEPWAGYSGYPNWTETWTPTEYAGVITGLPSSTSLPNLIAATGNKTDWETAVHNSMGTRISYYQLHPYTFSNTGNTPIDFPLTQSSVTSAAIDQMRGRSREPAITEYNLYCWDGIGYPPPPINPSAGGLGQALYLAQHLTLFAQKNIKFAAFWDLFEGNTSTWKCGLVKEDSAGNYSLTPAGTAFQMLSFLQNQSVVSSTNSSIDVTNLSVKSGNQISTVFINPTSASVYITYNPQVTISALSFSSLISSNITNCPVTPNDVVGVLWNCLRGGALIYTPQPNTDYSQTGNLLNLHIKPFSVFIAHVN